MKGNYSRWHTYLKFRDKHLKLSMYIQITNANANQSILFIPDYIYRSICLIYVSSFGFSPLKKYICQHTNHFSGIMRRMPLLLPRMETVASLLSRERERELLIKERRYIHCTRSVCSWVKIMYLYNFFLCNILYIYYTYDETADDVIVCFFYCIHVRT